MITRISTFETMFYEIEMKWREYRKKVAMHQDYKKVLEGNGKKVSKRTINAISNNRNWVEFYEKEAERLNKEFADLHLLELKDPQYYHSRRDLKILSISRKSKGTSQIERVKAAVKTCENQVKKQGTKYDYRRRGRRIIKNIKNIKS